MTTFKRYQINSTVPTVTLEKSARAKKSSVVSNAEATLDWPQKHLAYCRINFTDPNIRPAVHLRVTANSDSNSARVKIFGADNASDYIEIDHFKPVFDASDPDYIVALITSRNSDDTDIVLQFVFIGTEAPVIKEYPVTLKKEDDQVLFIPVTLA